MAKIISLVNHKGGVGKTTTTLNLGYALSQFFGKRVLLIDLDAQANLSTSLGFKPSEHKTIYDALPDECPLPIQKVKDNLDIVLSSLDLSASEMELINEISREFLLKNLIDPIKTNYDYILIDCAPSLGLLTINALSASDGTILVVESEFLALEGMMRLVYTIEQVQRKLNKSLEITGVLQTKYDSRLGLTKRVEETLVEHYSDKVFKSYIRRNVTLAEAPSERMSIFEYDSKSNGALDYKALAKEFIERTK